MTYCMQCGQPVPPHTSFRLHCGAKQVAAAQVRVAPVAAQSLPPVKTGSAMPFVLVVLGILALVAVVGIGGVIYVGYRVKEKVNSVARQVTDAAPERAKVAAADEQQPPATQPSANPDVSAMLGNLGKMLGAGNEEGDPVESISGKDPVVPCEPAPLAAQGAARIPLQPGTVITTSWGMLNGDVVSNTPRSITRCRTPSTWWRSNCPSKSGRSPTASISNFNKDTIKPESEPVRKEIVQAMTNNPGWKLTVEGNTDNVGGDSYNLDLSRRRAAAVKQTLVMRYHIAADRLSTDGFGSSHPIETTTRWKGVPATDGWNLPANK